MSKFHRLAVARVERDTRDATVVTFAVPDALRETFRHAQGQHLTLRADIDGDDVRRSYSICSPAPDGPLRIGADPPAVAVRVDRVQGPVPLRRLPRAFRLLQGALSV